MIFLKMSFQRLIKYAIKGGKTLKAMFQTIHCVLENNPASPIHPLPWDAGADPRYSRIVHIPAERHALSISSGTPPPVNSA